MFDKIGLMGLPDVGDVEERHGEGGTLLEGI